MIDWPRFAPARPVAKTRDERREFYASVARIGSHIRGRVIGPTHYNTHGHPIWCVEVYNAKTGRVLQSDNAYDLTDAINNASEHATIARLAWFYGFARRSAR